MEYFEYEKINDRYQKKEYLLKQVVKRVLFIVEVLYLEHQRLFSFDNVISYSIFALNVLQVDEMNKESEN